MNEDDNIINEEGDLYEFDKKISDIEDVLIKTFFNIISCIIRTHLRLRV